MESFMIESPVNFNGMELLIFFTNNDHMDPPHILGVRIRTPEDAQYREHDVLFVSF